jgi:uncharacterized membrane protein YphA (DoxX/SURF4 family)
MTTIVEPNKLNKWVSIVVILFTIGMNVLIWQYKPPNEFYPHWITIAIYHPISKGFMSLMSLISTLLIITWTDWGKLK